MLSRFDLIFVMEDRSDNRADSKLSDHVLAVHSRDPSRLLAARSSIVAPLLLDGPKASQPGVGSVRPTLEDRLALTKDDVEIDPLPMELLRRLVAYARAYITCVCACT